MENKDKRQIKAFLAIGLVGGLVALTSSSELVQNPINATTMISGLTAFGGLFGAAYKAAEKLDMGSGMTLADELNAVKAGIKMAFDKANGFFDETTDNILAFREKFAQGKTVKQKKII